MLLEGHKETKYIIMGDFNQQLQTEQIRDIHTQFNLIDIFEQKHSKNKEFNTHKCGRNRIDYILVSEELTTYITKVGYEPFDARIQSDHSGMYMDLSLRIFQDNPIPPI